MDSVSADLAAIQHESILLTHGADPDYGAASGFSGIRVGIGYSHGNLLFVQYELALISYLITTYRSLKGKVF